MAKYDTRKETTDAIMRRISDLNDQSLNQLSQFISYLKWQEELWHDLLDEEASVADQSIIWQYDFLEAFPAARRVATRKPDMMEIKVAPATCGMIQQMALWEHPPVSGSAVCEYTIRIPAELNAVKMRFAAGIRDGSMMEGDNLCAFRVYVNGVRLWTDALGDSRWNWAAWGEPMLLGYGPKPK